MFKNIGDKLEQVASIFFGVTTAIYVVIGGLIITLDFLAGLLIIIVGPFISLVISMFIHGFATIITRVTQIEENTRNDKYNKKSNSMRTSDSLNINYDSNIISKNEYEGLKNKITDVLH